MAYLKLKSRITVRTLTARAVNGVDIPVNKRFTFSEVKQITTSESIENFTNTASFSFPKGMRVKYTDVDGNLQRLPIEHCFGTGDAIKLEMWCEIPTINTSNPTRAQEINSKPNYKATFTGYISRVQTGQEIVFECEDQMYLFKRNTRLFPDDFLTGRKVDGVEIPAKPISIRKDGLRKETNSAGQVTGEVVTSFVDGPTLGDVSSFNRDTIDLDMVLGVMFFDTFYSNVDIATNWGPTDAVRSDIKLPGYRSEDAISLVEFFDDLKKYSSAYTFWRNETLYIGPQSWPEFQTIISNFAFKQNIIDGEDLKFQRADEIKYRVEITNIHKDKDTKVTKQTKLANGRLEYFGDAEGEIRELFVYNYDLTQKDALTQLNETANKEINRFKYTGFTGSFTTFGVPAVQHGDVIKLYDPDDANIERNGNYIVRAVERSFDAGSASYRQTITLANKV